MKQKSVGEGLTEYPATKSIGERDGLPAVPNAQGFMEGLPIIIG